MTSECYGSGEGGCRGLLLACKKKNMNSVGAEDMTRRMTISLLFLFSLVASTAGNAQIKDLAALYEKVVSVSGTKGTAYVTGPKTGFVIDNGRIVIHHFVLKDDITELQLVSTQSGSWDLLAVPVSAEESWDGKQHQSAVERESKHDMLAILKVDASTMAAKQDPPPAEFFENPLVLRTKPAVKGEKVMLLLYNNARLSAIEKKKQKPYFVSIARVTETADLEIVIPYGKDVGQDALYGSPLIDQQGQVVGVVFYAHDEESGGQKMIKIEAKPAAKVLALLNQ